MLECCRAVNFQQKYFPFQTLNSPCINQSGVWRLDRQTISKRPQRSQRPCAQNIQLSNNSEPNSSLHSMLKVLIEKIKEERCPLMRISRCRAIWSSECHFVQLLIYSRHASYCCYCCCSCHIYQVKTTRVGNSSGTGAIRLIGSLDSHESSDEVTKRL